jgi:Na+/H+ antiporter NhaC
MATAEQKAAASLRTRDPTVEASAALVGHAYFIWLPLLVLGSVLGWMLVPLGFPFGRVSGADFRAALSVAYLAAAATLVLLMLITRSRSLLSSTALYFEGMSRMMQVAIMLVLAWALSDIGGLLGTADYIADVAATSVAGWLIPLVVFGFSAVISFATGSSWGTFAIMFPLALPAAVATDAMLFVVIGAVLSGGLFGDHSSPISETTILSATGADCDQYAHFRTQLPYALTNGGLAALGFLLAGITGSWWSLFLVLGLQLALLMTLFFVRQNQQ